ncbi:hypothetical protein [Myroides odoratimimus]|uniref:hypothetical protein n=1 Tax=Myroides odoratimimus TaxID=76832 RepID=UPI000920B3E3|nr:hypothetical protein [Myroides odoratimimus]SHM19985.1 hypothetical protein SAMN05444275_11028 [Myroides odoratimimus subsp. xuanwuensis]
MMEIDITAKSNELKKFVSQFETTTFLGDISSLIQFISFDSPIPALQGLSSPQRQLLYIAGLNVTSAIDQNTPLKAQYSDEDFEHIKKLLNEIEIGYEQFFYPKPNDEIDEDWKSKRAVAMPAFLSYFNQGLLNFEEQTIERIFEYFKPFDTQIKENFGLSIEEFISIYNFIDELPNKFLKNIGNVENEKQIWSDFCDEMLHKGIMPFDWNQYLPEHFKNLFGWFNDKGKMFRYSKELLVDEFGKEKTDSFLDIFTCVRETTAFLYYTEKNIIHLKPIFNINENEFQLIDAHHLVQAIYNVLFEFCIKSNLKESFYALRGKELENKIERVLQRFFKNKAFVHKGYFTQEGHEQDLLFLYEGIALIIEAKASKRDEPRRDPDKAYPLILYNFEETIQKGYDQAYRVKSKFINNEILRIYNDEKLQKHIIDIRTKNYHNAFSIIVTLERFGQIQTDLSELLKIYDNDDYPLSICIDDLETFLLLLEKFGKNKSDLIEFLIIRQRLHGKIITADELEICGAIFLKEITLSKISKMESKIILTPDLTDIFDDTYDKGLGFENEKNLEKKASEKYYKFGAKSTNYKHPISKIKV